MLKALSEWDADIVIPTLAVIEKQFANISDKTDVKESALATLDEVGVADLDTSKSTELSVNTQESACVEDDTKSKINLETVMGTNQSFLFMLNSRTRAMIEKKIVFPLLFRIKLSRI